MNYLSFPVNSRPKHLKVPTYTRLCRPVTKTIVSSQFIFLISPSQKARLAIKIHNKNHSMFLKIQLLWGLIPWIIWPWAEPKRNLLRTSLLKKLTNHKRYCGTPKPMNNSSHIVSFRRKSERPLRMSTGMLYPTSSIKSSPIFKRRVNLKHLSRKCCNKSPFRIKQLSGDFIYTKIW